MRAGSISGRDLEVVDSAHAVPEEVFGDGFADENGLEAGFAVLAGGAGGEGFAAVGWVGILEPLALADGVVREDGDAGAGEGGGGGEVAGLAGGSVAGSYEDGGKFSGGQRVRQIHQGGDVEVGLGVEENLLDADAGQLGFAEDLRLQRRARRQGADEVQHGGAGFGLTGFGIGERVDFGDLVAAGGGLVGGSLVEEVDDGVAGGVFGFGGGCGLGLRGEDEGGER